MQLASRRMVAEGTLGGAINISLTFWQYNGTTAMLHDLVCEGTPEKQKTRERKHDCNKKFLFKKI